MDYKILENYIKSPLKIYDGCEPKHIFFNLKNEDGKILIKIDLWNFWDDSFGQIIIRDKFELKKINAILNIPIKKNFISEGDEVIALDIYENNMFVPVDFMKCKKAENYIVSFILNEKSPSRYQCYILAVLKKI